MATTRSLYRSLLRELPPRPLLSTPRAPLHQRLRDNFQQSAATTPAAVAEPSSELRAAQAEQYVAYLRAQRTYVTLLERYNPGMGMDEEERVRLTARRLVVVVKHILLTLWVEEEKQVEKLYINRTFATNAYLELSCAERTKQIPINN
ncbi:hypothetical protein B0I37DRAFT_408087 [Chaetomium sp. MPI-CAGE-AT-0009]|nr:hypothetical protein B0I37DRAFT_408087 [Chaetomium sp. MPI-CAGE-AT-0009]